METRTKQVSEQVQSGTQNYSCGTTDLGNGYFQDRTCTRPVYQTRTRTETYQEPIYRREPVYDTWLIWEVDRWVPARTLTSRGTTPERAWPVVRIGGAERTGSTSERLMVDLLDGENALSGQEVTEEVWAGAIRSRELSITRDWWGRVRSVTLSELDAEGGL
jgi:hypothetical protein